MSVTENGVVCFGLRDITCQCNKRAPSNEYAFLRLLHRYFVTLRANLDGQTYYHNCISFILDKL